MMFDELDSIKNEFIKASYDFIKNQKEKQRMCSRCKKLIEDKPTNADGIYYHKECFKKILGGKR